MGTTVKGNFVLVSEKKWHDELFDHLSTIIEGNWTRIADKNDFCIGKMSSLNPDMIFIPHWSYLIPAEIYEKYICVIFHMTDLPFGRGGSPLQNLIVRGFKETRISAIKASKGLDTGDVYLKYPLSLEGTAQEIFIRASEVIEKMIVSIVVNNIKPTPQEGEVVEFKRRKPEESNLKDISDINKLFDYIRMLDAEGYPHAYVETESFRLEFTKAQIINNKTLNAHVLIIKK